MSGNNPFSVNPCDTSACSYSGLHGYDLINSGYNNAGMMLYDPSMSMDTSIYSNLGMGLPMINCGCDSINGVGIGGFQPIDWTAQMGKWQDYNLNYQKKMLNHEEEMALQKRQANANVKKGEDMVRGAVAILEGRICANDQENIPEAFKKLEDAIREYYPNGQNMTEKEIKAEAIAAYKEITEKGMIDDIRKNGSSTFWNKFVHSASFGFLNSSNCAEETIANMTGMSLSKEEKAHALAGSVAGSAALGVGIGLGTKPLLTALGLMKKGSKAGFWGLVIGAAAGIGSYIISNKKSSINIPSLNLNGAQT